MLAKPGLEPFDRAVVKLLLTLPTGWSDIFETLSPTEEDALQKLVAVGFAECRLDMELRYTRWCGWSRRVDRLLYAVSGYAWVKNTYYIACRDAGLLRNGKMVGATQVLCSPNVFDFRLSSNGELARDDIQQNRHVGFILDWARTAQPEFKYTRFAWEHHEKRRTGSSAQAVAMAQTGDVNVQVSSPPPPNVHVQNVIQNHVDLSAIADVVREVIREQQTTLPAKAEAASEPPKPVEPQAGTLAGGDDAGGGRAEADGKPANLRPCDDKAWSQYRLAIKDNPELTTDQAAYDWFIEHVADEGETLPAFATWVKYLRLARAVAGEQKNKRGVGHETRSVVSVERLDQPKRTKADRD